MEDNNLLAEVNSRLVIRMERNLWSGERMTNTTHLFNTSTDNLFCSSIDSRSHYSPNF